jgi:hypothetical protein
MIIFNCCRCRNAFRKGIRPAGVTSSGLPFLPQYRTGYTPNSMIFQVHFLLTNDQIYGKSGNVLPDHGRVPSPDAAGAGIRPCIRQRIAGPFPATG